MDTTALRADLANKIKNSLNDRTVRDIARLIKTNEEEQIIIFTEEQQVLINKSLQDYKEGKYMTDEDAEKDIQEWLKD